MKLEEASRVARAVSGHGASKWIIEALRLEFPSFAWSWDEAEERVTVRNVTVR